MQSQLSDVRRYRNWKLLLLIAVLGLAGCAGEVLTAEQQTDANKTASAGQVLRVANLTAESGDLASASALYQRAHRLAPDEIEPLLVEGI